MLLTNRDSGAEMLLTNRDSMEVRMLLTIRLRGQDVTNRDSGARMLLTETQGPRCY
jgi:hypothetical protein